MHDHIIPDWKNPEVIQNPYPHYDTLRAMAPIAFDKERGFWVVSSYETCQKMLKDPRFTVDRLGIFRLQYNADEQVEFAPLFTRIQRLLIFRDGLSHETMRTPLVRALVMQSQKSFGAMIEEEVRKAFHGFHDNMEIDLVKDLAFPFPLSMICRVMGLPWEDSPQIKKWNDAVTQFFDVSTDPARARKASTALQEYLAYIKPIWEQRRSNTQGTDLLSLLHRIGSESNVLDEEDLLMNIFGIFLAGHETTSSWLSNGISALLSHPEEWRLLREDHSKIAPAIEEMLRFDAPVQRLARAATEDIIWDNKYEIKKGQYVALFLGAANRDQAEFEHPHKFWILRPRNRHLAFGSGAHHCAGAQLARLEVSAILKTFLTEYPNMELVGEPAPYFPNLTFRCRQAVRLRLKK